MNLALDNVEAAHEFAGQVAAAIRDTPLVIYLSGELGAGKTTLVRGILAALGVAATVKSPSYTLLEPYRINGREAWHMDLYRLASADELEALGMRDFEPDENFLFVEWPERGTGFLPGADLVLALAYDGQGRRVQIAADSAVGKAVLGKLEDYIRARA